MKYFKAIKLLQFPFIMWDFVDEFETPEEFDESIWASDPLVKSRGDIVTVFDTYPYHIVDGEFVDRTEEEMTAFEEAYNIRNIVVANQNRIDTLLDSTFTYDGKQFPMDEASRLYYSTFPQIPASKKLVTTSAEVYGLLEANIPAFMTAFYQKLSDLTEHDN